MPRLSQNGFAPIIAIIITFLIIGGTAVVIQREVKKQQQDKAKSSQTPKSPAVKEIADQNKDTKNPQLKVELAKDSFVSEPKQAGIGGEPGFSITPPSGWAEVKDSASKVAWEAPDEDKLRLETADTKIQDIWLSAKARITVRIGKASTTYLDAEVSTVQEEAAKVGINIVKWEKTKLNGEDAFYFEGTQQIEGTKIAEQFKAQLESEIAKIGKGSSTKDAQSKIDKLISDYVIRHAGYYLYKDGYLITISTKLLDSFWGKRGPQVKASIDTFKFLPK